MQVVAFQCQDSSSWPLHFKSVQCCEESVYQPSYMSYTESTDQLSYRII